MADCARPESLYGARPPYIRFKFTNRKLRISGAKSVVALKRAAQRGTVGLYAVQHCAT